MQEHYQHINEFEKYLYKWTKNQTYLTESIKTRAPHRKYSAKMMTTL